MMGERRSVSIRPAIQRTPPAVPFRLCDLTTLYIDGAVTKKFEQDGRKYIELKLDALPSRPRGL